MTSQIYLLIFKIIPCSIKQTQIQPADFSNYDVMYSISIYLHKENKMTYWKTMVHCKLYWNGVTLFDQYDTQCLFISDTLSHLIYNRWIYLSLSPYHHWVWRPHSIDTWHHRYSWHATWHHHTWRLKFYKEYE